LQPVDLVIIVVYLAAVIAAGAWFGKRQNSTNRYFFGGRNVPWWAVSASIVATETSTITFISVPGIVYAKNGNYTFLQLVFGYLLGRVVISFLFMPSYFRGSLVTVYELLQDRFGARVKALAASLFVCMRTIADAIRLLLTAIVVSSVVRAFHGGIGAERAITEGILAIGAIMIVFTVIGGIEAVVWVEVAELAIYITGAVGAAIVLAHAIPGGLSGAISIGSAAQKFRLLDFSFDLTKSYVFWSGLIGGCFLTMSTHGTDQSIVQRYMCTDTPRKGAMALLSSGVIILVQFTAFLSIGVLLFAFYRPDRNGYMRSDQVFPDFITQHLPSGLSGLVVAGILAAAMKPSLNAIASAVVADLYAPVVRGRDDGHYLRVSRIVTVLAGFAMIGVALVMQRQQRSALDAALSVASLVNGPILGAFLLSAAKRGGPVSAFIGMLCGIGAVAFVWLGTHVAWPWYAVVGSLTTFVTGAIVYRVARASSPRPSAG
jgi:SSS family solute:Na+ symporter